MFSTKQLARTQASFMSKVYFWMMLGLAISGSVAYLVANSPALSRIYTNQFIFFGLIIAQLGVVFWFSALVNKMSGLSSTLLYLFYSALSGMTFSIIFLAYTQASISQAFFITSFAFIGLSLFGFLTKRDLGPLGTFCMTGLFGLIGFMLVTLLFPSIRTNAISMSISFLTIIIFSGLTAYDTQKIKNYHATLSSADEQKAAVNGALMLYLDFINIFLSILNLFGNRR